MIERSHQNDLALEIERSRVEEVEVEIGKIANEPEVEIVKGRNRATEKGLEIAKDRNQRKNLERSRDHAHHENHERRHDLDLNQSIECIVKELQVQKIKLVLKREIPEPY